VSREVGQIVEESVVEERGRGVELARLAPLVTHVAIGETRALDLVADLSDPVDAGGRIGDIAFDDDVADRIRRGELALHDVLEVRPRTVGEPVDERVSPQIATGMGRVT